MSSKPIDLCGIFGFECKRGGVCRLGLTLCPDYVREMKMVDPKEANPKAALGSKKIPLGLVSPVGLFHEAMAMDDGATKYGAWNFREVDIKASVYLHATLRHLCLYYDGEDHARDSKVHHLGHAKACLGIWLDSIQSGNYVDDRPPTSNLSELFDMFADRLLDV